MRHRKRATKLSRDRAQRRALARSLAIALITRGRLTTTRSRGQLARRYVETLVTVAKRQDLTARRRLIGELGNREAAERLLQRAGDYAARPGGYTRVTRYPLSRRGDRAPLATVEFVS